MLPPKLSHNTQNTIFFVLWAKGLMQIGFTLKCIQYMATSVLQREQHFWCKKMVGGQKFS